MLGVVNRNLNRRIRQALYTLKRMFGGTVYISKKTNVETDYETGIKSENEQTWKIDRCVVLPMSVARESTQSISMISANKEFIYGGTYDIGTRNFIIDAQDLPKDFIVEGDDWLVYDNKRYQIKKYDELEQHTGWLIIGREVEGIKTPVVFVIDRFGISDSISSSENRFLAVDNFGFSEFADGYTAVDIWLRDAIDSLSIDDSVNATCVLLRDAIDNFILDAYVDFAVTDALSINESAEVLQILTRGIIDNLSINDVETALKILDRTYLDTLSISDIADVLHILIKDALDTASVDEFCNVSPKLLDTSDSLSVNHSTSIERIISANASDNLALSEIASDEFNFTWKTDNTSTGSSTNVQAKLPLVSSGTYDFVVNWGDLSQDHITTWNQAEVTHTYAASGTYTISISGLIRGWAFNNGGDKLKILNINRWGPFQPITAATGVFNGCSNLTLTSTQDDINLSYTNTLQQFFQNCTSLGATTALNNWDVSGIISLYSTFVNSNFNGNINNWDVSNVGSLRSTFQGCTSFNQSLNSWDVSSVINMNRCFYGCTSFNGNITSWDVSNVTDFDWLFYNCSSFNQNIGSWNPISGTTFNTMLYGCTIFNQNIGSWNVGNGTNFDSMLGNCQAFNQNLNSWDMSSATDTSSMFYNCTIFNGNITSWDVSNVQHFEHMFNTASAFNQNISGWNTGSAIDMNNMFLNAAGFNQNISTWTTTNVTTMFRMFKGATSFNQDLGSWNVTSLTDAGDMFSGVTLTTTNYSNLLIGWAAEAVQNSVALSGGGSKYNIGASASRAHLVSIHSWSITDGGPA